jgi:glycerophosphoryl diester phosphodiesterase
MRAMTRRSGRAGRILGVPLVVALALGAGWYGIAWVRHTDANARVQAIAHRGGPGTSGAPEGTITAFRASVEAGADWLEFDVRVTRDGVLVVLHDETVDRTTDGTGNVWDLTFDELRALDAGAGAQVPTVDEVVRLAREAGLPILPEVKDGPGHPEVTPALLDLLDRAGYLDRTVIQAFEPAELQRIHALRPDVETCLLTGWLQFDPTIVPAGTRTVCPLGEMLLLNPDMIRQAHASHLRVFAWWAFAESALTDGILGAFGVDGLIVDDLSPLVP